MKLKHVSKAVAGAVGVILVWLASLAGLEIPSSVEAAIVTLVIYFAPANTSDSADSEPINDVV